MKRLLLTFFIINSWLLSYPARPKPDAQYNIIRQEFILHEDGSIDHTYRKELTLHSQRSFYSIFGETFIVYNPSFQQLTINESYTKLKDGTLVNTPKNALNEVLPSSCTDCQRYNKMKEMVVTHTALEYDATIVLDYTIHSKPTFVKELTENILLAEYAPVERYEITVSVPKGKSLLHNFPVMKDAEKKETEKDGKKIYTFIFKQLKQTSSEAYLPNDIYYTFCFSTIASKSDFVQSIANQNAFQAEEKSHFTDVVASVTSKTESVLNNALSLRNFVADNIHENSIAEKYNNYIAASADMVWESNCGNESEKNILLNTLLHSAGISSEIVIAMNDAYSLPDARPHYAVYVPIPDGAPVFISATGKEPRCLTATYPHREYYNLKGEQKNSKQYSFDIATEVGIIIQDDNGTITPSQTVKSCHINVPKYRLFDTNARKKADPTIKEVAHNYYAVTLRADNFGSAFQPYLLPTHRENPLEAGTTNEQYAFTISLPDGYQWVTSEQMEQTNNNIGMVNLSIKANDKETMTVTRKLRISTPVITVRDYGKFRQIINQWTSPTYRTLYFKKAL